MARTEERKKNYKNVSCELTNSMWEKLDKEAKLTRSSKAEIIRKSLSNYLYRV